MTPFVCITALIVAALAPTTSHQQIRDSDGRAWMLIRSKKVLVLHAPEAGQLQVAARSAGARKLRIRAAGDVLAAEPLAPGNQTILPGQRVGDASLLRVPVPSGGEIYRIEVPKGRAWVAVSLLTAKGAMAFEQPEAVTPSLVGLGPASGKATSVPGLVALGAPTQKKPPLKKPALKMPGLVALGDRDARKRKALSLGGRKRKAGSRPGLKPLQPAKSDKQGPAVIDRPITELPDVEEQEEVTIARRPKTKPKSPQLPAGPTLMERLAKMELGLSVAGMAQGRADRLGGQVEIEMDLPGTKKLLAAAFYLGFAPSNRSGVARIGAGAALPLMVSQKTREIPLGLTLRARPLRLRVANRNLAILAELNAGWHLREGETTIGMVSGSVAQPLTHTSDGSGLTGGLGVGAELALSDKLLVGAHARVEASKEQQVAVNDLIRAQLGQSAASLGFSLRYRFGS